MYDCFDVHNAHMLWPSVHPVIWEIRKQYGHNIVDSEPKKKTSWAEKEKKNLNEQIT